MYQNVLFTILAFLVPTILPAQGVSSHPPKLSPNIIFIMADDLGYGDLGSYGQQKIHTPRLDQMAREGMRFTSFYAGSTVCAPSRSVLMTGQHTGHTPIRGNLQRDSLGQEPLPSDALTIAELLKSAGYRTGMFGKWGLGGPGTYGSPNAQGFDAFYGYLDQHAAHFYYPEFLYRNEQREPLPGNKVIDNPPAPGAGPAVKKAIYSHDRIVDEALSFIGQSKKEYPSQPFFLYLPVTVPHAELAAPQDAMEPYTDSLGNSIFPEIPFPGKGYSAQAMPRATYAAMVTRLDRDVGRILDTLRALGLDRNTIVFFTSDNGPHAEGGMDPEFFNSNGPLHGKKRDLYEGGIRVPMIAWGPGRIPAGRVSDHVWASWDVFPTVAELSGAKMSLTQVQTIPNIDGISALPTLLGTSKAQRLHKYLYWEFYEGQGAQAVRQGRWKAVRKPIFTGEVELYNLEVDPSEERNVAAQNPKIVSAMRQIMERSHIPSALWHVKSSSH